MAYKVDPNKCISCHTCIGVCPVMAIAAQSDGKAKIDPNMCVSCGTCAAICPVSAIAVDIPVAPVKKAA
ncbi:4Fe-4S ferredoxin [Bacteroidia bacterium]|nr:4Fe-4S ferredoxin [Bacteroidia bacterium]